MSRKNLSFGVGSFHFAVTHDPPFTITPSRYRQLVGDGLHAIPAIGEVTLELEFYEDYPIQVLDRPGAFANSHDYLLPIEGGRLGFDLHIPVRVQEELLGSDAEWVQLDEQDFVVNLIYSYHCPVAFVFAKEGEGSARPATAVRIVREFLYQEFPRLNDPGISFECLGPSPFHAEFFIGPNPENDLSEQAAGSSEVFGFEQRKTGAYDLGIIRYNTRLFADADAALPSICEELSGELGLFYEAQQLYHERLVKWDELRGVINQQIASQKQTGLAPYFRRVLGSRDLDSTYVQLLEFEGNELEKNSYLRRSRTDMYSSGVPERFSDFFRPIVDELNEQATAQSAEILSVLRDHAKRGMDSLVLLAASFLGGSVGALLTVWLASD